SLSVALLQAIGIGARVPRGTAERITRKSVASLSGQENRSGYNIGSWRTCEEDGWLAGGFFLGSIGALFWTRCELLWRRWRPCCWLVCLSCRSIIGRRSRPSSSFNRRSLRGRWGGSDLWGQRLGRCWAWRWLRSSIRVRWFTVWGFLCAECWPGYCAWGRLPVCCNYIEYYFADSAGASSVDHGLAPVSGSVVGNCGGAGGHDSVAADEEKGVNRAARAKFFTTREHRGHRETQGPASSTALCRNLRRGKPRLYRSFTSTRDRY